MPISTSPLAGDVHVNRPLTNFSQKYLQDANAFIAMSAMPNLPVAKQSDLYYVFDRDDFFRDEAAERADGTESQGGGWALSTEPYFCRTYSFHKDVTDRQRANQDSVIQLDNSSAQYVSHKMLIKRETNFKAQYFNTGIWATDVSKTWSGTSDDPIVNIREARRTVQGNTGYQPNKMVISRAAYDILLDNDALLSRITGGSTREMPAMVMRELLAQLFELDRIFVMDAIVTTSKKGETAAREFIGGSNALVYYAPDSVSISEPSAGVQFSWTGLLGSTPAGMRIKKFRIDQYETDRVEGDMSFDHKVTGADLGYFFTIS